MFIKHALVLLIGSGLFCSCSSIHKPSSISSRRDLASSQATLTREMQPYLKVLSHPVYVYHYVKRSALKLNADSIDDVSDPAVFDHVKNWSLYYFDLTQPFGGDVKGLYTADDPFVSRSFGGDDWFLYRIELSRGHKYLDLRPISGDVGIIPFSVRQKLENAGCLEENYKYIFRSSRSEGCREIAVSTLHELKADSIFYNFDEPAYIDDCQNTMSTAMILLNGDKYQPNQVRVFTSKLPSQENALSEAEIIQALETKYAGRGLENSLSFQFLQKPFWENLSSGHQPDTAAWVKEHWLRCLPNP